MSLIIRTEKRFNPTKKMLLIINARVIFEQLPGAKP